MARFFISYTIYDRDAVERIERALTERGHTVFVDRGVVAAGSSWAETIRDEIEKTDAFMVLVSGNSLSRDFAVSAEVGAAWERRKRIVAVETSDASAAVSLPLPRADYEIVHANGMSDSQLVDAIAECAKAGSVSQAS